MCRISASRAKAFLLGPLLCTAAGAQLARVMAQIVPAPKRRRVTGKKAAIVFDLGLDPEKADAKKAVYLVTLRHPQRRHSADGRVKLVPPESLSRQAILDALLDSLAHPMFNDPGNRAANISVSAQKMVLGREPHLRDATGAIHMHDHIALLTSTSFRFLGYKRALLLRHGLASHWSCTHAGYWSAVRYIVIPSESKPWRMLDKTPLAWSRSGDHPPVFDAAQEPCTAAALRARREKKAKSSAEKGKPEPRITELDIYPIIVERGFRNTPDDQHAAQRLVQYVRQYGSPQMVQFVFKHRARLPTLIDDVWEWECVDDTLKRASGTRVERLAQCLQEPCVCSGRWPLIASSILLQNGHDQARFWHEVYMSLHLGRREDRAVMTLVGRCGGEGKSFLFSPLKAVYGIEGIQFTSQAGSFPLYGLETKKVVVMDDWRFDKTVLPLATQFLWFEGKPVLLVRPQNQAGIVGHLVYRGTAPIFITTKEHDFKDMIAEARRAEEKGEASECTMLLRRLSLWSFTHKLALPRGATIPDCPCCFARTVLSFASMHQQRL